MSTDLWYSHASKVSKSTVIVYRSVITKWAWNSGPNYHDWMRTTSRESSGMRFTPELRARFAITNGKRFNMKKYMYCFELNYSCQSLIVIFRLQKWKREYSLFLKSSAMKPSIQMVHSTAPGRRPIFAQTPPETSAWNLRLKPPPYSSLFKIVKCPFDLL